MCWEVATTTRHSKQKKPEVWELCVWKSVWFCRWHIQGIAMEPALLRLKIAHNQSTGRRISVLLKRINVQRRGRINGWQDSKGINMDMLFGITTTPHRPVLISCAFVQRAVQRLVYWKKYLPVEKKKKKGLWRTTELKWQHNPTLLPTEWSNTDFRTVYPLWWTVSMEGCCLAMWSSNKQPENSYSTF